MQATAWLYNPVVLAAIGLAVLLAILFATRAARRRVAPTPYARRTAILSSTERDLLAALREAAGEWAIVLVRVPMRDVLAPRRTLVRRRARNALARLRNRRFDFVLCAPDDTRPLVAIVLDREPRKRRKGQRKQTFEEAACEAAGLGLLRLDPQQRHSAETLQENLRGWLEPTPASAASDPLLDGRREPILDLPQDD